MLIRLLDKKRGFPTSLPEFQRVFPDDAACERYLESIRWPEGFLCPKCGTAGEPYRFPTRSSVVLRCRKCKANTSLMAGTVMQSSHTPLSVWFWGAYLVTTEAPGQSAVQFQRQLGLTRYETAFQILHKLRAGMVRPERDTIGGEKYPVEVDECYVGGESGLSRCPRLLDVAFPGRCDQQRPSQTARGKISDGEGVSKLIHTQRPSKIPPGPWWQSPGTTG